MKTASGFTLIELVITISIIGILSGYALPSFSQLKQNKHMAAERNRLTTSLQFARSHAIYNQDYVIVCPSISGTSCDNQSNWHQGWIVFVDKNKDRNLEDDDILLQVENAMLDNITAISSINRQKIRYNLMGFSPGTNLSINFCDDRGEEFAQAIIVSNSGRVKQSKPISNNVCS